MDIEMAKESKAVKDFFHGYAEDFDSIYGHNKERSAFGKWIDRNTRQTMYLRFEKTLEFTASPEIETILDIGCGGGRYIIEFLDQGKKVTGLDIASGMIDLAKTVVEKTGNSAESVDWVLAGYMDYKPEKKHDAAVMMGFFDYIAEPLSLLNKLSRDITKELYMSFPKSEHWLAGQRQVRYQMRNCPLYLYKKRVRL